MVKAMVSASHAFCTRWVFREETNRTALLDAAKLTAKSREAIRNTLTWGCGRGRGEGS